MVWGWAHEASYASFADNAGKTTILKKLAEEDATQ